MTDWLTILAPYHILILHFPLALIYLILGAELFAWWRKGSAREVPLFLWGCYGLSAILASLTGWFLAEQDYSGQDLFWHRWLAIAATVLGVLSGVLRALWHKKIGQKSVLRESYILSLLISVVLMTMVGHFGGSMTHGSHFLNSGKRAVEKARQQVPEQITQEKQEHNSDFVESSGARNNASQENAGDMQAAFEIESDDVLSSMDSGDNMNAVVSSLSDTTMMAASSSAADAPEIIQAVEYYEKKVVPLLAAYCYECHNESKAKGGLRLDSIAWLKSGGNSGPAVVAGHPEKSPLYMLSALDPSDPDIMPAKGDPLTKEQLMILEKWIRDGAHMQLASSASDAAADSKKQEKRYIFEVDQEAKRMTVFPAEDRKKLEDMLVDIRSLDHKGAIVDVDIRYVEGKNLVSVMRLLSQNAAHVYWLQAGRHSVNASAIKQIGNLYNLRRLHLDRSKVDAKSMSSLLRCQHLRYLNVSMTGLKLEDLEKLTQLPALEELYCFETKLNKNQCHQLQQRLGENVQVIY